MDLDTNSEAVTDASEGAVTEAPVQEQQHEETHVPNQSDERLQAIENHLKLLAAQQQQSKYESQEPDYDDEDDDVVLTRGEGKKTVSQLKQELKDEMAEIRIGLKYPDYQETLKKYLPKVLEENPALRQTLMNDPNRFETAYFLAKRSDAYLKDNKEKQIHKDAEKVLKNAKTAGNLSSVGHATGGVPTGHYSQMNDSEFQDLVNKNLGYI